MHSFCSLIIKFILIFKAPVLVVTYKYKGRSGKENTRTIPPFFFSTMEPAAYFTKVLVTFRARKAVLCLPCLHSRLKLQQL